VARRAGKTPSTFGRDDRDWPVWGDTYRKSARPVNPTSSPASQPGGATHHGTASLLLTLLENRDRAGTVPADFFGRPTPRNANPETPRRDGASPGSKSVVGSPGGRRRSGQELHSSSWIDVVPLLAEHVSGGNTVKPGPTARYLACPRSRWCGLVGLRGPAWSWSSFHPVVGQQRPASWAHVPVQRGVAAGGDFLTPRRFYSCTAAELRLTPGGVREASHLVPSWNRTPAPKPPTHSRRSPSLARAVPPVARFDRPYPDGRGA